MSKSIQERSLEDLGVSSSDLGTSWLELGALEIEWIRGPAAEAWLLQSSKPLVRTKNIEDINRLFDLE